MQALPLILQDQSMSQAARNQAKRLYFIKKGYSKQEIDMILPLSPDELHARNENEVLGHDTPRPIGRNDDHASHITIHMRGQNTPAMQQHIAAHTQAMIQLGETRQLREQEAMQTNKKENLANMAQSQIGKSETNNLT